MNYVISICNPKSAGLLSEIHKDLGIREATVLLGKGTAVQSMLDILGIEDNEKRIFLAVADREATGKLIEEEKNRLFVGVPGHGIVIAIPVKSVGGGKTLAYLNNDKEFIKRAPESAVPYELIIAIANSGYSDTVMNAARKSGARGGTVIHGKGTGAKGEQKFYNVSIASEKEIVMIVASFSQKADIMRSVISEAGPASDAGAIVFSLPISEVAGFGMFSPADNGKKD